jgi:hypothetical protein
MSRHVVRNRLHVRGLHGFFGESTCIMPSRFTAMNVLESANRHMLHAFRRIALEPVALSPRQDFNGSFGRASHNCQSASPVRKWFYSFDRRLIPAASSLVGSPDILRRGPAAARSPRPVAHSASRPACADGASRTNHRLFPSLILTAELASPDRDVASCATTAHHTNGPGSSAMCGSALRQPGSLNRQLVGSRQAVNEPTGIGPST